MPTRQGSFKIFHLAGIDVYVNWSWFLAFYILPKLAPRAYSNFGWSALEVLGLFLIVLTHEFGHAFACRSVGGQANLIVLWPLGGVAYVAPPQRPGAQLWSITAGPLVNVILFPIFTGLVLLAGHFGWNASLPDLFKFLNSLWAINLVLLVFNLLPIFPLDGGQILRSLLWFVLGRANSLFAATIIGFIGVAALIASAGLLFIFSPSSAQGIWLGIMAVFILLNCWGGLMQARALARVARMPRRDGFACPECKSAPPLGPVWRCGKCGGPFDTFATLGVCPHCGTQFDVTQCFDCGSLHPIDQWATSPLPPPIINV